MLLLQLTINLFKGQAFSQENGPITDELIWRAAHNHTLTKEDDCMLFEKLYNAFCGSKVETTITSEMKQNCQGSALWLAAWTK